MPTSFALSMILALGVLAACTPGSSREPAAPLENTYWRLVELGGRPAVASEGPREAHLRFADSARVSGSTGCNRLTGTFTREGAALRFGQTATTRMACVEAPLNQQEQDFLAALRTTERHEIAGDTLGLVGPSDVLARLVATAK